MHRYLLALAGPAEAGLSMEWLIAWAFLALVAVLLVLPWCLRLRILILIAAALMAFSLLFAPWQMLEPWSSPIPDPDVNYWSDAFQHIGWAWMILLVATLISIPGIFLLRKRHKKITGGFPIEATMDAWKRHV